MIQEYIKNGKTLYKVRVFARSQINPNLRLTKQQGHLESLAQAQKEEHRLKKDCDRELMQIESRGVLFGDLLIEWNDYCLKTKVASGQRSSLNQGDYFASLHKWLGEYKNKSAGEFNSLAVSKVFEQMKIQGISFGHRKKFKQVLKSVFDYGIQSNLIKNMFRSPTYDIVLGRDVEKKPEILTLAEIQRLIEMAYEQNHAWRRVWSTAILTGMRSGELLALEKSDVDFENMLINVNKSHNCRLKIYKSTKAGYWRQIPISTDLEKILKEQFAQNPNSSYVFEKFSDWEKGGQARILRSFCYLIGLPSIKFHTLRACFATQMLRSGVEPAKVMKIGGWKELKTMQRYVRLSGIDVMGATEVIKIMPLIVDFKQKDAEGVELQIDLTKKSRTP